MNCPLIAKELYLPMCGLKVYPRNDEHRGHILLKLAQPLGRPDKVLRGGIL